MSDIWLTVLSGGGSSAPPHFLPELAWFDSLEDLEAKAGIRPGTPVIIDLVRLRADPEGYWTERVFTEFLRTSHWSRLTQGTRATYATVHPPIIRWLASRSIPKALHEMDANDLDEWKEWSTDPIRNEKSISGATWNKEVAALSLFFKWAVRKKYAVENPIEEFGPGLKFKDQTTINAKAGGWKSKNARIRRVDWIEPETFRLWSNVAFRRNRAQLTPPSDGVIPLLSLQMPSASFARKHRFPSLAKTYGAWPRWRIRASERRSPATSNRSLTDSGFP